MSPPPAATQQLPRLREAERRREQELERVRELARPGPPKDGAPLATPVRFAADPAPGAPFPCASPRAGLESLSSLIISIIIFVIILIIIFSSRGNS